MGNGWQTPLSDLVSGYMEYSRYEDPRGDVMQRLLAAAADHPIGRFGFA